MQTELVTLATELEFNQPTNNPLVGHFLTLRICAVHRIITLLHFYFKIVDHFQALTSDKPAKE